MISYSMNNDIFSDIYEIKSNSNCHYLKPKNGISIILLNINDTMDISCDNPEFEINIHKGSITIYTYDPDLVPGCGVECAFKNDIELELLAEYLGFDRISNKKRYKVLINIKEKNHE